MKDLKQPLVSIVVVTYNSSRYVIETLESVKNQTWHNIELIITDDCSTDNTLEVCSEWVEKNKAKFVRSKIITSSNNTGIPSNCNRGVMNSTGQWLKLIAGDDILIETCIEYNLLYVENNPNVKFVISELIEIDDDSCLINNQKVKDEKDNRLKFYFNAKTAKKQLKAYARWPVFLNSPSFFYNKQTLIDINYFDEEYRIFDDTTLIYRVNSNDTVIHFMNKPTVKYRIHEKSISRRLSINSQREKEVLSIFKKYREENLSRMNLIDLSIYYELWLNHYWKGYKGYKGGNVLSKLSLFYWYFKFVTYKVDKP